jgi:hypothetical protein
VHSSLHVVRSDGSAGPALGRQVSTEQVFRDGGGGRLVHAENLFWAEPGWAPLSDGYAWCLPREFHCDIWSKEGKHVRIVRAKFSGETIPAEAYTQLESQRLLLVNTQNDSARVRRGIADGDRPNVFPILSLIRGDRNDRIWMREFVWRTDAKKVRWLVFEKTGKVLGTITLPADLWIYEIGDDYIVGTDLDENDVQRVVQYRYREATGISRQ